MQFTIHKQHSLCIFLCGACCTCTVCKLYVGCEVVTSLLEIWLKYAGNIKHAINRITVIVKQQSHAIAIVLKIAQPKL